MKIGVDEADIVGKSDSLTAELTAPPSDRDGICPRCRTWMWTAGPECENCTEVREALGADPLSLSIVALYRKPSQLRDWLTRYKGRQDEEDTFEPAHVEVVRCILGRFIIEHGEALEAASGGFDAIVVVPSTDRQPPHPLEDVVASLMLDVALWSALERGPEAMGFRQPARRGYQIREERPPRRVLLLDDVYTTGSRLNSAAAALADGGHHVAGSLVLARRVNPDYSEAAATLWRTANADQFQWTSSPWVVDR